MDNSKMKHVSASNLLDDRIASLKKRFPISVQLLQNTEQSEPLYICAREARVVKGGDMASIVFIDCTISRERYPTMPLNQHKWQKEREEPFTRLKIVSAEGIEF